ncbi:hypothetical protein EJB05_24964, partial [Eragrostis curvula]
IVTGPSFRYVLGFLLRHQTDWPAKACHRHFFAASAYGKRTPRVWSARRRRRRCSRHLRHRRAHIARSRSVGLLLPCLPASSVSFRRHLGLSATPLPCLLLRRRRLRSATSVGCGEMDPEDFTDSEEEEEDDDLMLFILPALYLASTQISTPGNASTETATPRNISKRVAAPAHTSTGTATPGQASKRTATPGTTSKRTATPGTTSKRKRNAKSGHASAGTASLDDKKKFRTVEWICKVLEDDRGEGYDKLQVGPQILQELSVYLRSNNLLQNTRGASVEEKVGMFIYMLSQNASFQKLSSRFVYSTETIHRHIKACFDAVTSLTSEFVKPPSTQPHWKISSDQRYGPYFENCIGAIDGIHVPLNISESEAAPYKNREESISHNVMLACDFDLNIVYVYCGREGSASDAAVLYSAIGSGFEVPGGKFYLVDRGYANTPSFLAPYIGVPYPTVEQEQSSFQPQDYMELFNLRHAQLHNHIKHAIGLLKSRFPILNVATGYRKETQLKIPAAAVVLHNVFQKHRGEEERLSNQTIPSTARKPVALPSGDNTYCNDVAALNSQCYMGDALRDGIALRMWADYERDIQSRKHEAFVWNSEDNQLV